MPQFRLTQKFAADCKIRQLNNPAITTHPLDDWFIDRMIADRKKIAMITHGKSTFTFFIPYADAGGARKIISCFKMQLQELFQKHSLPVLAMEIDKLFTGECIFTKTVDRKILGHMNDFRYCSTPYEGDPLPVDWNDTAERINNMPTKGSGGDYLYPIDRLNALLGIQLPKRR